LTTLRVIFEMRMMRVARKDRSINLRRVIRPALADATLIFGGIGGDLGALASEDKPRVSGSIFLRQRVACCVVRDGLDVLFLLQ
jgi:hypothetical protein